MDSLVQSFAVPRVELSRMPLYKSGGQQWRIVSHFGLCQSLVRLHKETAAKQVDCRTVFR